MRNRPWLRGKDAGNDNTGKAYADLRKEAFQANMYSSKNQNQPISFAAPLQQTSGAHISIIHSLVSHVFSDSLVSRADGAELDVGVDDGSVTGLCQQVVISDEGDGKQVITYALLDSTSEGTPLLVAQVPRATPGLLASALTG